MGLRASRPAVAGRANVRNSAARSTCSASTASIRTTNLPDPAAITAGLTARQCAWAGSCACAGAPSSSIPGHSPACLCRADGAHRARSPGDEEPQRQIAAKACGRYVSGVTQAAHRRQDRRAFGGNVHVTNSKQHYRAAFVTHVDRVSTAKLRSPVVAR